jgi:ABC-type glycerol-3-phosphate transport system substrate-binding protein
MSGRIVLSRRALVAHIGASAALFMAACGGAASPTATPKPAAPAPSSAATQAAPVAAAAAAQPTSAPTQVAQPAATQGTPAARPTSAGAQPVEMTFWTHQYKPLNDLHDGFIAGFQKENPNVKVNYQYVVDKEYNTKMMATLQSGGGPDALLVFEEYGTTLPEKGVLVPLDPTAWGGQQKWEDLWIPEVRKQVQVNGKDYYGVFGTDPGSTIIGNTKLMDEKKLPWKSAQDQPITWDDLASWAKELTATEGGKITRDGYMITNSYGSRRLYQMYEPLLVQNGGQMVTDDGTKCVVNSEAGVKALEWHNKMINELKASLVRRETLSPSGELPHEKTAMGLLGFWVYPKFKEENAELAPSLKAIILPQVKGGTPYYFGGSLPSGYGVPKFSKQQDWGWKYLEFTSRSPNDWLAKAGSVIATKGWAQLPAMNELNDAPVWKYVGERAKGVFHHKNELLHLSEIYDGFQRAWERTILNKVPAKQSLDQLAGEVDKVLAKTM